MQRVSQDNLAQLFAPFRQWAPALRPAAPGLRPELPRWPPAQLHGHGACPATCSGIASGCGLRLALAPLGFRVRFEPRKPLMGAWVRPSGCLR
eukprot:15442033-Alexandrium_andersonii.AAC.1